MCLILLAWHAHPDYPLIFAGNRDERYERPSAPAEFWPDAPDVFGGRDLEKGGTWLGVTRAGRFAAITAYRQGTARPNPLSRGWLTAEFLRGQTAPREYLDGIATDAASHSGFTLLVGDAERIYGYSNRCNGIETLTPGVHGLSNHLLDTPWPKVVRGKARLSTLLDASEAQLIRGLFDALSDRQIAADADLPDTGVGIQRERELSAAFMSDERYGTRASTVMLVGRDNQVIFEERRFGPRGAPLGETARRFSIQVRAGDRVTKAGGQVV